MATIVNTPAAAHEHVAEDSSSSATNLIIGVLVFLVLAFLLFYFGLPMIRSAAAPAQAPQINVPDKVNVDVNPNVGGGNAPAAPQQ
jgi:hypothetical protein